MSSGRQLDIQALGIRVEVRNVSDDALEIDVIGRPRGFLLQEHVHTRQVERHEMVSGEMRLVVAGREHLLQAGDSLEVPAGVPHRQLPAGDGPGHDHITVRPAASTLAFLERLEQLSRDGHINRWGYPAPLAAAELIRDFAADGRSARPSLAVQLGFARAVLAVARAGRRLPAPARPRAREYVFVDEWDVAAPQRAVYEALADATTWTEWWRPVYVDVDVDGPPAVGVESRQHFKGRLPYHLHTVSRIVRLEPHSVIEGDVVGDLRGRGTWTLTPAATGTHVRFDWRVYADRALLAILTPVLRPLFRWNHNWAIARAREGLEPYARRRAETSVIGADPNAATLRTEGNGVRVASAIEEDGMSVLMTFRAKGDPAKLEASAAEQPELMRSLVEDAKRHGVLSHRFYGTADGDIMVLDEWESEDGFNRFFAAHPEIKELMAGVGVTQEPEVKFWRKLETHDEVSPQAPVATSG